MFYNKILKTIEAKKKTKVSVFKEQIKATIKDANGFVRIDPRFLSNC